MSYPTDGVLADDWEVVGGASIGGADIGGAEVYLFEFRSADANWRGPFLFAGIGSGLGGNASGSPPPDPADPLTNPLEVDSTLWSQLTCDNSFSANDLNWSSGAVMSLSATVSYVGYTACWVSAGMFPPLFTRQDVSGWSLGIGLSGTAMFGVWKKLGGGPYY